MATVETLKLTQTRRCPKRHVEFVRQWLPDFQALPEAPEGTILHESYDEAIELMEPGAMVICRYNAPLVPVAFRLLRRKLNVKIAGKNFGEGLVALVRSLKASDIASLSDKLETYRQDELAKVGNNKYSAQRAATINDRVDTLQFFIEEESTVDGVIDSLSTIFSEVDAAGVRQNEVLLSSIHRSKGLEADWVFIIDPSLTPAQFATQEWQLHQERNLQIVGYTRSKNTLVEVYPKK